VVLSRALLQEFRLYAAAREQDLPVLTGAQVVDLMLSFYRDVRAEDSPAGSDGDMLLFQWGTYDWGTGENFEFDMARQLILPAGEPEDADESFWQLHLTLRLPPTAALRCLAEGDRWCHSVAELEEFGRWIREGAAYRAVATLAGPIAVDWECAG
jgi:hypothetical protein